MATSKTRIGLYETTRTSSPIDLPDLAKLKPGEAVELPRDEPLPRVNVWLNNIMRKIQQIRDSDQAEAVKAFAERCSVPATRLMIALRDVRDDSTHNGQFVAYAMEIAAELADEWQSLQVNATLEQPVTKYRNISTKGRNNIAPKNRERQAAAIENARCSFLNWRQKTRIASVSASTLENQLKKFFAVGDVSKRDRERLRKLLKVGRLEK